MKYLTGSLMLLLTASACARVDRPRRGAGGIRRSAGFEPSRSSAPKPCCAAAATATARSPNRAFLATDVAAAATTIAASRRPASLAIAEAASPIATARKPCPDLCRPLVADFFTCAAPSAPMCRRRFSLGESSPGPVDGPLRVVPLNRRRPVVCIEAKTVAFAL